jgi:hypothetical protein
LPEAINNPVQLTSFGNQLGVHFSSAKWYLDWSDDFTPEIARGFQSQGAIPELDWQPQDNGNGISFNDVTAGKYDGYINNFARATRSLGSPIRINLAPEVNGNWEPWGIGNNGNNPDNFKAFYRYVVNKFRAQGASNVSWIFAPNIHYWGESASYADLYPGDSYVDFTGLDGYNWGTTQSWSSWQSFSDIFRSSYNDITSVSSKNVIITEFASTEVGGNKAQWILDMFRDVRGSFPRISGITWFNENKETDWRINSSDASMEAFKNGANGNYDANSNYGASYSASNQNGNQNQNQSSNSTINSSNSVARNFALDNSPQANKLKKTEKYILPAAKTTFFGGDPPKAVKAASTVKKNYQIYFTNGNIILAKMILEFFLFSIILIAALLVEPKFAPEKNQNQ